MDFKELFKEFMIDFPSRLAKFEQTALETGLDKHISTSEIHIINKIGPEGSEKMNAVSKRLGVTQATLTVACDKLEAKELITRRRDPEDKRAVTVRLTPQGLVAYGFHQALMDNIAEMFISGLDENELERLCEKIYSIYDKLNY